MSTRSEWIVLAGHIERNDIMGLSLLKSGFFSGSARLVYEVIKDLHSLSWPIVEEALRQHDPELLSSVWEHLFIQTANVDLHPHMIALSYRHGSIVVKQAIDNAYFKMHDGEPIQKVRYELESNLSLVNDIRTGVSANKLISNMEKSGDSVIASGFPGFDTIGLDNYFMGNILTIGGDSGGFKTTTATELIRRALQSNPDLYGIFFSKEQRAEEIAHKFMAKHSQVSYGEIMRRYNKMEPTFCSSIASEIKADLSSEYLERLEIVQPYEFSTIQDIVQVLRSRHSMYPKIIWVIDYLTAMNFGGGDELTSRIREGLLTMKEVTHKTNSFGIIISQLQKGWNEDWRTKKKQLIFPQRHHLVWSSELINVSAYIMMLLHPRSVMTAVPPEYLFMSFEKVRFTEGNWAIANAIVPTHQVIERPNPSTVTLMENFAQKHIQR
jgi:hypothetical protein